MWRGKNCYPNRKCEFTLNITREEYEEAERIIKEEEEKEEQKHNLERNKILAAFAKEREFNQKKQQEKRIDVIIFRDDGVALQHKVL